MKPDVAKKALMLRDEAHWRLAEIIDLYPIDKALVGSDCADLCAAALRAAEEARRIDPETAAHLRAGEPNFPEILRRAQTEAMDRAEKHARIVLRLPDSPQIETHLRRPTAQRVEEAFEPLFWDWVKRAAMRRRARPRVNEKLTPSGNGAQMAQPQKAKAPRRET